MSEIEVIKIGQIIPNIGSDRPVREISMIMILSDGDSVASYYVDLFKQYCKEHWNVPLLNTSGGIIRPSGESVYRMSFDNYGKNIKGIPDGDPIIGQSFTINDSSWHTSKVLNIINDIIIVTKNFCICSS